jgi:hypothetical protein
MIYSVKKRGGVWTVAANEVLLTFDNYGAAVDRAQGAADVLRRCKTRCAIRLEVTPTALHSLGTSPTEFLDAFESVSCDP